MVTSSVPWNMAIVIVVHTPLQQKQAHFHYSLKLSKSLNGKQQKSFKTKCPIIKNL
jgi:hypothetical protein